jgi:DNA-binding transcriptional regulator GbsR (MarR family)
LSEHLATAFAEAADWVGLSRPAGRCLAAIWIAAEPPTAEGLVAGLGLSRSNVSTALKELRGWGLVTVVRRAGERKEYFAAPSDPWDLIRLILAGRQRRALAPLVERVLAAEAETGSARAAALHDALTRLDRAAATIAGMEGRDLKAALAAMGGEREGKRKKGRK